MTVDTFGTPKNYESAKTMTVTRMATATRLIPVTVDTFHTSSKTMTTTRMATAARLIPVTVDTFDISELKSHDPYGDGDRNPPDPCDC